jgi:hypothetical protein
MYSIERAASAKEIIVYPPGQIPTGQHELMRWSEVLQLANAWRDRHPSSFFKPLPEIHKDSNGRSCANGIEIPHVKTYILTVTPIKPKQQHEGLDFVIQVKARDPQHALRRVRDYITNLRIHGDMTTLKDSLIQTDVSIPCR